MQSDYASKRWTRFAKHVPLRSKSFKRPYDARLITSINDFKYPWAAYKRGWKVLSPNLDVTEFNRQFADLLNNFNSSYLLYALSLNNAIIPVGILSIHGIVHVVPYVEWFPWATARNKVEVVLNLIRQTKNKVQLMIYASDAENNLMRQARAYGLLHWGCVVKNYYPDGTKANFYYSVPK